MKICAIHQPNFLPWLGYFDKIRTADVFVFLDDVQFSKSTVVNRVKIRMGDEAKWLTCPILHEGKQTIKNLVFDSTKNWRRKHLKAIEISYCKSPNFKSVFPLINDAYSIDANNVAIFNTNLIRKLSSLMEIGADFVNQSSMGLMQSSTDLLIEIVRATGCDTYLCGGGAATYQEDGKFKRAGIELLYQNFKPLPYGTRQPFLPGLSAIDFLMER